MVDTVTFEIPPMALRLRAVGLLAASLGAQLLAILTLGWFTADAAGETLTIELLKVRGEPALSTGGGVSYYLVMIVMLLFGLTFFLRTAYLGVTIMIGHPLVKRGLFRSKLQVAWMTPLGAHIHTAILLGLAVFATITIPTLHVKGTNDTLPAELSRSWGGFVFIAGLLLMHVAILAIARNQALAATQCWEREAPPEPAKPREPRERPMMGRSRPQAPRGVDATPFREPPPPELETRLVRPPAPRLDAPRADDAEAPQPRLLN